MFDARNPHQSSAQKSDKPTHASAMAIAAAASRTFGAGCARFETKDVLSLINALRAEPHYEKDIKNPHSAGNNGI
jgi:hypothetical protein